jgi:hypothetical protein
VTCHIPELVLGRERDDTTHQRVTLANSCDGGRGGSGDAGEDGDGRGHLDSHVGRRRVSTDRSASVKSKGHRSRESADFTEVIPHFSKKGRH